MSVKSQELLKLLSGSHCVGDIYTDFLRNTLHKILKNPEFAFELAGAYKLIKSGYPISRKYPEYVYQLAYILSDIDCKYNHQLKNNIRNIVIDLLNSKDEVISLLLKDNTVPFLHQIAKSLFKGGNYENR